jgi:hypothetical protein
MGAPVPGGEYRVMAFVDAQTVKAQGPMPSYTTFGELLYRWNDAMPVGQAGKMLRCSTLSISFLQLTYRGCRYKVFRK